MTVSCKKCSTIYSKLNFLSYLFNYLEPYIRCSNCRKDVRVDSNERSRASILLLKVVIVLAFFSITFFLVAKSLLPPEGVNNDEYHNTERGQLWAKVRNPYYIYNILGGLSMILTFFCVVPILRYINWK